ncbi:MAG: O-antigen translocase [bacterium]
MKDDRAKRSYQDILKSTSVIGSASVVNIGIGLVRFKVAALLLGPAGVGLIGLLQNLMTSASSVSALGFANAGTRQIAEARGTDDAQALAVARKALFLGSLLMAIIGGTVFWVLREQIARTVLGDPSLSAVVGWLAPGVAIAVMAGSQGALLNGLRRIGDIARLSILSALLSALLGVGGLVIFGDKGIVIFVLSVPLSGWLFGRWFVSRLPKNQTAPTPVGELHEQWKILVKLGSAFMIAGLAVTAGQLVVRVLVKQELGAEALGYFQAAWMISMTYVGLVLGAMGADYYPRLTATIRDHAVTNRLVNEQTEVALWLAGPLLLAMLGLAPWVIELLYTSEFGDAARVLRWQLLGDILKVASWPLGFILLALGDGRIFMLKESMVMIVFVGLVSLGLPHFGIQATGAAFLGMYLFNLPLLLWLARRRTGFVWERRVVFQILALMLAALIVFIVSVYSSLLSAVFGLSASFIAGFIALARLSPDVNPDSFVGRCAGRSRGLMNRLGIWCD